MARERQFGAPQRAWMRAISENFEQCVRQGDALPDADRARLQHRAYRELLERLGVAVEELGGGGFPDSCFIEDTAVVLGEHVVVTRPGCVPRRGETELVRSAFEDGSFEVASMVEGSATLEGGDVMRAGNTLFVGCTERTNLAGVAFLTEFAGSEGLEVVPVEVRGGLHLKSVVTLLDPSRVVCYGDGVDLEPLRARGLECVEVPEFAGANVLAFGPEVIVSAAAPRTAELLDSMGCGVHTIEVGELHKADGALTCLSLRFPPPGGWCV